MLLSILFLISFSFVPASGTPIPIRRSRISRICRAPSTTTSTHSTSTATSSSYIPSSTAKANIVGWPYSTTDTKDSFGISGSFNESFLGMEDGKPALIGHYPKGSYAGSSDPGIAGFIFSATGGADLDNAKEAFFSYEVKFPSDFHFALAGKLPGMYGGSDPATAGTCAGGNHDDSCWSARLMWRENGIGELYAYLPTANQRLPLCQDECDLKYGASLGRGNYTFPLDQWTQLDERVKLNDVGKMNGEIEVYVGGQSKIRVTGVQLRGDDRGRISGIMMHTFFGGSSSTDFKSPQDQQAYFRNFKLKVTEKF